MSLSRLIIAALALALTAGLTALVVLGSRGAHPEAANPLATARGARLLNPYCGNLPAPEFDQPPNRRVSGRFVNAPYGYEVTIPQGMVGYAGPDGPPGGFGILLSRQPRAYLRVEAAYDVFYDLTAAAVHRRDVLGVRLHDTLLDDRPLDDGLAGAAGGRYRMQVRCPGDPQVYVHDDLIVVRNREIYRIDLQSVLSRYAGDALWLAALQRSWRWIAVPASPRTSPPVPPPAAPVPPAAAR